jgi:hypothetical protein
MATVTTGNPWTLSTAEEITTKPLFVNRMVWTPTTDGDDLLVVDNSGATLWSLKAIAADTNQGISYERVFESSVNGITITTIDHGTLYVHIR